MTVPAATNRPPAIAADSTVASIDASCRLPLFMLFGGAAFWLALSSVFGFIASLKFHKTDFLADAAWLTYGRVYPASTNLLVYGFAIPVALGVAFWLLARLGRVELARPWLVTVGAKLWHIGVFVGLIGILAGDSTGFEWLEMPRYAAVILLLAYLLMAVWAFFTHHARTERALYPSQWFVLAALFWFPWIYSSATLLLQFFPVRGVTQAAIAWWYSGNLLFVWLALAGLAASFYFLPKLVGRPLQSGYLALFVFWTLILFGTWVGIPAGATLPAWMPTLSNMAAMMMMIPAATVVLMAVQTTRGAKTVCRGGPLCYVKFGIGALALSVSLLAANGLPFVNRITDFTWYGTAKTQLWVYGFFAMTMFGAVYFILPRVAGFELPAAKGVRVHFWCGVIGTLLFAVPLATGGVLQGVKLANPDIAFTDVTKATLMFFRLGTMGELLILAGNFLFLFNIGVVLARYYRTVCCAAYADVTAPLQPAEVKP